MTTHSENSYDMEPHFDYGGYTEDPSDQWIPLMDVLLRVEAMVLDKRYVVSGVSPSNCDYRHHRKQDNS